MSRSPHRRDKRQEVSAATFLTAGIVVWHVDGGRDVVARHFVWCENGNPFLMEIDAKIILNFPC
jgi:hypothetical protein